MNETVEDNKQPDSERTEVLAEITATTEIIGYQKAGESPEKAVCRAYNEMAEQDPQSFFDRAVAVGTLVDTPTETTLGWSMDIGDVFILPEEHPRDDAGDVVEVTDYTQPSEYGPGVYAYADVETGEHQGLFTAKDGIMVERIITDEYSFDL